MKPFKVGDIAVSRYELEFTDGTEHLVGQQIEVTEQNLSYFLVCWEEYDNLEATPDEDILAGRTKSFDSVDEMLDSLKRGWR